MSLDVLVDTFSSAAQHAQLCSLAAQANEPPCPQYRPHRHPRLPPPLQDPRHHPNHGRTASYSAIHKYAHQLNKGELGEEHAQGGATGRSGHVDGLPIRDLPNSATVSVRGESPRDRGKAPRLRAEKKAHARVGPGSSDSPQSKAKRIPPTSFIVH